MEVLSEALQKVGAAMYGSEKTQKDSESQSTGESAGPEDKEEAPKTEEAVEGEVVEEGGKDGGK